jgi:hypothetical protein
MLRIVTPLLVFASIGGLVAGCGGSSNGASDPSRSITKTQALAYAHAVELQSSDVPDLTLVPPEQTISRKPSGELEVTPGGVKFARCTGGVNPHRRVAAIASPTFQGGTGGRLYRVKSEIIVWPTAALAAKNAKVSPLFKACLNAEKHNDETTVSVSSVPVPGVPRRVSDLRVAGTIDHVRSYQDSLTFLSGPAEIRLTAFSIYYPVPPAIQHHLLPSLLSLVYSRAEAHKL